MTTQRISSLVLCAATFVGVLGMQASAQERGLGAGGQLLDGVAAVVNDGVVLKSELNERLELVVANLRKQQEDQPVDKRRAMPPTAVTIHVKVQPLAWNMGSVQR